MNLAAALALSNLVGIAAVSKYLVPRTFMGMVVHGSSLQADSPASLTADRNAFLSQERPKDDAGEGLLSNSMVVCMILLDVLAMSCCCLCGAHFAAVNRHLGAFIGFIIP